MTPVEFSREVAEIRLTRMQMGEIFDVPIKDLFLKKHPEISEPEFNNLVTVAHNKGLI